MHHPFPLVDHVFVVDTGFTDRRPVQPDQMTSRVTLLAPNDVLAVQWSAQMVMRPASPALGLRAVQMPTGTVVVDWCCDPAA